MNYTIAEALPSHVPYLAAIEDAAGEMFSLDDLPEPARSTGLSREAFEEAVAARLAWVATEEGSDVPVAFVLAEVLDGCWHVVELDVHPTHARRGLGSRLLEHMLDVAASRGFDVATLTTFEHVPWNAPFYARRGFRPLRREELGEGLARVLDKERALGMRRRVAMARPLGRGERSAIGA